MEREYNSSGSEQHESSNRERTGPVKKMSSSTHWLDSTTSKEKRKTYVEKYGRSWIKEGIEHHAKEF